MRDEAGSLVFCRISHDALRDHAKLAHFEGPDNKVFEANRELLEQLASDAFDAGKADEAGCILVTKEVLNLLPATAAISRYPAGTSRTVGKVAR
jgi:hypothetical protein